MKKKPQPTVDSLIRDINTRLDSMEDLCAWLIKADARFKVGQRVKLSTKGRRQTFKPYKGSDRATVKGLDGFCVVIRRDHQKRDSSFHHSFWEAINP